VHYWVEGALEVAFMGVVGLVLMTLIPVPEVQRAVDKYIFAEVVLAATSGLIGQGHHYFWIGTPNFWILFGGLISVLEIVPLALMIHDAFRIAARMGRPIENRPSLYYLVGIAVLGFVGVGLYGGAITWPWSNWWEHGTWLTPAHGHLCMSAFGMGAISLLFLILPGLTGKPIDGIFRRYGTMSFWFWLIGAVAQSWVFSFGGTVQVFHYRVLEEGWQQVLLARAPYAAVLPFSGLMVFIGFCLLAFTMFRHILSPIPEPEPEPAPAGQVRPGFFNTFAGYPLLIVLALAFSLTATLGIWSFGSEEVIWGLDPKLPYTLSFLGYTGLGVMAVLIAIKLIRGLEAAPHLSGG